MLRMIIRSIVEAARGLDNVRITGGCKPSGGFAGWASRQQLNPSLTVA
jgi:hypothetical protein